MTAAGGTPGFEFRPCGHRVAVNSLRLLAPPAHTWQLLTWQVESSDDLRRVRAGLHQHFQADRSGIPAGQDDVDERMAMVATELAGNALRHGLPPVIVRLLRDADCYIVDVSDHAGNLAPQLPSPPPQAHAGGRGLFIAQSLADELCWYPQQRTKHVWASFPAPPVRPSGR